MAPRSKLPHPHPAALCCCLTLPSPVYRVSSNCTVPCPPSIPSRDRGLESRPNGNRDSLAAIRLNGSGLWPATHSHPWHSIPKDQVPQGQPSGVLPLDRQVVLQAAIPSNLPLHSTACATRRYSQAPGSSLKGADRMGGGARPSQTGNLGSDKPSSPLRSRTTT
jgi:hypothetical protein